MLVLVHANSCFLFLVWCIEFIFKALHSHTHACPCTHSGAQSSAKYLGRAGPVWQIQYNQNANESVSSVDLWWIFWAASHHCSFEATRDIDTNIKESKSNIFSTWNNKKNWKRAARYGKKKIILHRHWQIQFRDHSGLVGMIIFVSHFSFSLKKTITVMLMWHSLESVQELNQYICWPITDISASAYTVSRLHYRSLWQVFDHHIGRVTAKNVYILAYI